MLTRKNILLRSVSILMMLILLWLTVSTPFVNTSRQERARQEKKVNASSPLAGTEEEKVPTTPNTVNEYLHESEELQHPILSIIATYQPHRAALYRAFHGELVSPPPEA